MQDNTSPAPVDGRHLRSERRRRRILEALAEILTEPHLDLSPEQLAASSGYSISTIFRHFGDQRGFLAAMETLLTEQIVERLRTAGPFRGDLENRVTDLVDRLADVFEFVRPFQLRAKLRHSIQHPDDVATYATRLHALSEGLTRDALSAELASEPEATLQLLTVVQSYAAWDHLRSVEQCSAEQAAARTRAAVLRVLTPR